MTRYLKGVSRARYRLNIPNFSVGANYYTDERCLPLKVGRGCVNFDFSTGALKTGWGIGETLYTQIKSMWLFTRYYQTNRIDVIMYCGYDGYVYYIEGNVTRRLGAVRFSGTPIAINYRLDGEDVILMCGSEGMYVWNGKGVAYLVEDAPDITSLTVVYERMFVSVGGERNAVWFSDDLNPTNWNPELDEGGFIQLIDERGRSNRVVGYNNYVYVFRDYGITRMSVYGAQEDFSAVNLFVASGRIYPESVALCGDRITFCATDGIYTFDGVSVNKISSSIDGLVIGGKPTATYYDGKYFLVAKLNDEVTSAVGYEDNGTNNGLIVYDFSNGAFSCSVGCDVSELVKLRYADSEKLYAVSYSGEVGEVKKCDGFYGKSAKKVWYSGDNYLGYPERKKLVREIHIDTKNDITVVVTIDGVSRSYELIGSKKVSKIKVNRLGTKIALKISANTDPSIACPTVCFSLI